MLYMGSFCQKSIFIIVVLDLYSALCRYDIDSKANQGQPHQYWNEAIKDYQATDAETGSCRPLLSVSCLENPMESP